MGSYTLCALLLGARGGLPKQGQGYVHQGAGLCHVVLSSQAGSSAINNAMLRCTLAVMSVFISATTATGRVHRSCTSRGSTPHLLLLTNPMSTAYPTGPPMQGVFSKAADAVKGAGHRVVEGVKYATGLKGEEGEGELGSTGWGVDNRGRKGWKVGQVTGCREVVMVGRMALRLTTGE